MRGRAGECSCAESLPDMKGPVDAAVEAHGYSPALELEGGGMGGAL